MMKSIVFILSAMVVIYASPSFYNILRLPAGTTVAINADISKWPQEYFIDSIHGDANVFWEDDSSWARADFQMQVLAAWDDSNVYFAAKVVSDDIYSPCGSSTYVCGCDNLLVNPGLQAAQFYLFSNGSLFRNVSNPWQTNSNLQVFGNPHGGENNLPSYDISISRKVMDQFDRRSFQFFVGTDDEDGDSGRCSNECRVGIGVEFLGNRHIFGNQDRPSYYPTWYLSDSLGPVLKPSISERGQGEVSLPGSLLTMPNPFSRTTTIHFQNQGHDGSVVIADITGKVVSRFRHLRESQVSWNAEEEANGVYFVKVSADKQNWTSRIFLMK